MYSGTWAGFWEASTKARRELMTKDEIPNDEGMTKPE